MTIRRFRRIIWELYISYVIVACIIAFTSCTPTTTKVYNGTKVIHDTIIVSVKDDCPVQHDTVYINSISLKQADAISTLEQIIYYEKIINRNPSQRIYEHGWITRALKHYNIKK